MSEIKKLEKKGRQGLYVVGSVMILLGFMTVLAVLFAPAWQISPIPLLDLNYSYLVGLLGAIAMIVFGAVISAKARGRAKVTGFMLYGDVLEEADQ